MKSFVDSFCAFLRRKKFIENVQKWVSIDTQIKAANEKIKNARQMKSTLCSEICAYADKNALNETTIEISDGDLRFYEKREYQPISFGYVEECLEKLNQLNNEKSPNGYYSTVFLKIKHKWLYLSKII